MIFHQDYHKKLFWSVILVKQKTPKIGKIWEFDKYLELNGKVFLDVNFVRILLFNFDIDRFWLSLR